ncbi:MAG: inositol monophosphatase family protein [Rhodobacteraceae bacterium]|nr:inositol monophosphatase family protein [Paracoccaceae bacterium]
MFEISKELQHELRATANLLADTARPIALSYFRKSNQDLKNKLAQGFDPVTAADREIELAMRAVLAERRPDDGILGEEFENFAGSSGLTWVLDPIDGTRGFISGTPTWGVLVAVSADRGPVLGLIDQPYTGERFFGGFGGAELVRKADATPLKVRACPDIGTATLFSTFPEVGTKAEYAAFSRVRDRVRLTRYGTDCYAYALLAAGQIDLVIEAGLNAFDIQGPQAVIENAGGIVTDWRGGPAHQGGQVIAAGDATLHRVALDLLNAT